MNTGYRQFNYKFMCFVCKKRIKMKFYGYEDDQAKAICELFDQAVPTIRKILCQGCHLCEQMNK